MLEQEVFYVIEEGKVSKPLSFEQFKRLPLKGNSFVKTSSMEDFQELQENPVLSKLFNHSFVYTVPQYFASLDVRLLAWFIDFAIVFAAVCLLWVLPVLLWVPGSAKVSYLMGVACCYFLYFS